MTDFPHDASAPSSLDPMSQAAVAPAHDVAAVSSGSASSNHEDTPANVAPGAEEEENAQIGAFSAYVRRPIPTKGGMLAQFFGEDGDDADTITVLSLTKFVDSMVNVDVFLVKDSDGRMMRQADDTWPKLASFQCTILRPKPAKAGMLAQFFAPNGDDADAALQLGLSNLQDGLAFVQVNKPAPQQSKPGARAVNGGDSAFLAPQLVEASERLTPAERAALQKRAKLWDKSAEKLKLAGFLNYPAVWSALGTAAEYGQWLNGWKCCANSSHAAGSTCNKPATGVPLSPVTQTNSSQNGRPFFLVPLCEEHAAILSEDPTLTTPTSKERVPGGIYYLNARREQVIQEWAWDRLKTVCGAHPGMSPDPARVSAWAHQHKIANLLPREFLMSN